MATFNRAEMVYLHEMIKINRSNKASTDAFGTYGMAIIDSAEQKIKQDFVERFGVTLSDETAEG